MLVLARRVGETLLIGENVQVTVLQIGRRTVRLKIGAPRGILVDRDEVRRRRMAESELASHEFHRAVENGPTIRRSGKLE